MKGKLIIIEGGDGAGKGTQIKMLEEYFGDKIITTREPGGTPFAEKIRSLALDDELSKDANGKTQFSLMWAARADHMDKLIVPEIRSGRNVICDRFDSSTFAYNVRAQESPELEKLFWVNRTIFLGAYTPDLYIYLDVDAETSNKRQEGVDVEINHFDEKPIEFKDKMRKGMLEFFQYPDIHNVIIDASRSVEEVHADILKVVIEATD